jgi:hypothetical protein
MKNLSSENIIPVPPLLKGLLEQRRERIKPIPSAHTTTSSLGPDGAPLNFHNLQVRIIKPAFAGSSVE